MNIVYASDDNFSMQLGISILSLLKNKGDEKVSFYILDNEISKKSKALIDSIAQKYESKVTYIDVSPVIEIIKNLNLRSYSFEGNISYATYLRIFLGRILPQELKKVIYIDCDTLITDSLAEIEDYDLKRSPIGAVCDYTSSKYKLFLKIPESKRYYNLGLMVLDLQKWKENNCEERIVHHIEHVKAVYPLVDQDIINIVLGEDEIIKLPLKYNIQSPNRMYHNWRALCIVYDLDKYIYYSRSEYIIAMTKPSVIHFSGVSFIRPWYSNSNHPDRIKYEDIRRESPWKYISLPKCKSDMTSKIRMLMYYMLPQIIFGYVSRFFMRRFIEREYLSANSKWREDNKVEEND